MESTMDMMSSVLDNAGFDFSVASFRIHNGGQRSPLSLLGRAQRAARERRLRADERLARLHPRGLLPGRAVRRLVRPRATLLPHDGPLSSITLRPALSEIALSMQ